MDILLYIKDHPGCYKSEIYRNVTRNAHTRERIDMLEDAGLLSSQSSDHGRATVLSLTRRGARVADLLLELETVLEDGE